MGARSRYGRGAHHDPGRRRRRARRLRSGGSERSAAGTIRRLAVPADREGSAPPLRRLDAAWRQRESARPDALLQAGAVRRHRQGRAQGAAAGRRAHSARPLGRPACIRRHACRRGVRRRLRNRRRPLRVDGALTRARPAGGARRAGARPVRARHVRTAVHPQRGCRRAAVRGVEPCPVRRRQGSAAVCRRPVVRQGHQRVLHEARAGAAPVDDDGRHRGRLAARCELRRRRRRRDPPLDVPRRAPTRAGSSAGPRDVALARAEAGARRAGERRRHLPVRHEGRIPARQRRPR